MPTTPENANLRWSKREIRDLKRLAGEGLPTRIIAMKLGRTIAAVQSKATSERISFKARKQL